MHVSVCVLLAPVRTPEFGVSIQCKWAWPYFSEPGVIYHENDIYCDKQAFYLYTTINWVK